MDIYFALLEPRSGASTSVESVQIEAPFPSPGQTSKVSTNLSLKTSSTSSPSSPATTPSPFAPGYRVETATVTPVAEIVLIFDDTTTTLHHKSVTGTPTAIVSTTSAESVTGIPIASVPIISAQATTTTVPEQPSGAKQDWKSIGIKAGVGTAIPLLVLIGVGVFLWRRHRRRREVRELSFVNRFSRHSAFSKPAFWKWYDADKVHIYELDAVATRVEMPLKSPIELPGAERAMQRHQAHQQATSNGPL